MIDKVRAGYRPSLWHVFVNPSWLSRRALYRSIRESSKEMTGRVLDFGCGRKPYQCLFSNSVEYIGLDTESSGHDHSNSLADIFYDGVVLPFENGSFDGIFSSQVLEHVQDVDFSLSEFFRVLKPAGKLLLSVPFVWNEHEQPYDFRRFTMYGLQNALEKYGFTVDVLCKTGIGPEAIAQMMTSWFSQSILRSNKWLIYLFTICFFSIIHISAKVLSVLLPDDETFYLDLVVLATRNDECGPGEGAVIGE